MGTLLKYKESRMKGDVRVVIEIAIERTNHVYLSVCGKVWDYKQSQTGPVSCGQCTDEMREFFPEYHDFLDLHLSDINGEPMYAIENGLYYLKNSYSIDVVCKHFRIDKEEAKNLWAMTTDERIERINSYRLRWKLEMCQAIKRLEKLCGQKLSL